MREMIWGTCETEKEMNSSLLIPHNPMEFEMKLSSVLKDRTVILNDYVSSSTMAEILFMLRKLERIDEIEKRHDKLYKLPPIYFNINSGGGGITSGLQVCSRMFELREKGYEIITTVTGSACSMGWILLVCGSKRRAYKFPEVMIHQLSSGAVGKYLDIIEEAEYLTRIMERMKSIALSNTKLTNEKWDEIVRGKKDYYFTNDELLEYGIVDIIL